MAEKIPKKLKRSVRYVALETIERVDKGGAYSNLLLNEMMQSLMKRLKLANVVAILGLVNS